MMSEHVFDCQTPFEKRVYFGTLAAAMFAVAVTIVELSERQWLFEQLLGAGVGLFVVGVLVARQLLSWVDEVYCWDDATRVLTRRRQVGPFVWDIHEATAAELKLVRARWISMQVGRGSLRPAGLSSWVEVETQAGHTIRLTDVTMIDGAARMPDVPAQDAHRFAKLFGIPLEEWVPFSTGVGKLDY